MKKKNINNSLINNDTELIKNYMWGYIDGLDNTVPIRKYKNNPLKQRAYDIGRSDGVDAKVDPNCHNFQSNNEILKRIKDEKNWNDDNVIEFVNWYLKLHKLNPKYYLENKTILDSFKKYDSYVDWDET